MPPLASGAPCPSGSLEPYSHAAGFCFRLAAQVAAAEGDDDDGREARGEGEHVPGGGAVRVIRRPTTGAPRAVPTDAAVVSHDIPSVRYRAGTQASAML